MTSDNYVAGSCNIGAQEIHRRYQVANVGIVLYAIHLGVIILLNQTGVVRGLIFIPAFIASIGFMQGRRAFCVAYGFAGIYNLEKLGLRKSVGSDEARKADQRRALVITGQALALALVLTTVAYLI